MSEKNGIKLVVIEGPDKGKVISLKSGTIVIGRSKGDYLLQDARISRSHIAFHYDEKTKTLKFNDLESLNGVSINSVPTREAELHDGDRIQIGSTVFDCQMIESTEIVQKPVATSPSDATHPNVHQDTLGNDKVVVKIPLLERFKKYYLHFPQKQRRYALIGVALVFGMIYLFSGNDSKTLDKEWESVSFLKSQGKIDEAIKKANEIIEAKKENAEILYLLGMLYEQKKDFKSALASFQKAKEHKNCPPQVSVHILKLYAQTGLATSEAANRELTQIDSIIKSGPRTKEFIADVARLFLENKELNQLPEKIYILAKALQNELAPDQPIGFKLEGQVLFQQNRINEALKAYEMALSKDPNDEWVIENIAFTRLTLKDIAGTQSTLDYWIKMHPESSKAHLVMAYLKFQENKPLDAFPFLQKIIQKNAGDEIQAEALHLTGQIYASQNQISDANIVYQKACDLGHKPSCESLNTPAQPPSENP
jgi:tetratricopeptide (TPR) repeat protein